MKKLKVIGVGFHKTGTKTLGECLRILGYNHISYDKNALYLYYQNQSGALLKLMEFYDSFEDWPWPHLFKDVYETFPESKFILTTRKNEEVWFKSLISHVKRESEEDAIFRNYIPGYVEPEDNKEFHINRYLEHNEKIRDFFADKPGRLLEVCWEKGDSWDKLCRFLNEDIPAVAFPHSNKSPDSISGLRRVLTHRIKGAVKVLLFGKL
jgi:hypothetical protein